MYLLDDVSIRKEYDGTFTVCIQATPDPDDSCAIDIGIRLSLLYSSDSFSVQCVYDPKESQFTSLTFWFNDSFTKEFIRVLTPEEAILVKQYCYRHSGIANKIF